MKTSSLILILGPIILISIIAFALHDTSIKNIESGMYTVGRKTEFTTTLNEKLNNEGIKTNDYHNLESCKEEVKNGNLQLCIETKPPEKNDFNQLNQNIILHLDFSKQRTVWKIIGQVQGIVDKETEIQRETMIQNFKTDAKLVKNKIEENKITINNTLQKLNMIKTTLKEIKTNEINKSNSIEDIIDKLEETKEDLENTRNYILPPENSRLEIDEAINIIQYIINDLNAIQSSSNKNIANNARLTINSIISELKNAQKELEEINKKLDNLDEHELNKLTNPVQVQYESVLNENTGRTNSNLQFLDYLFPSFLIFFILFNSVIFSASTRLKERISPAYIRNIVSNTKQRTFILGDYMTSVILISIQTIAILLLSSLFLNMSIIENLNNLIPVIILSVGIFSLLGITIGTILNNQESVIITSISISLLLFIFSSLVTPIETLPKTIASLIKATPLTIFENKLRLTTIFNFPITFSPLEIIGLIIFTTVSLILIGIFSKKKI